MAGQRCFIKECSEGVLQEVLEYLSFIDRAHLSLTCKAFTKYHMAGSLEIQWEQAQQTSLDRLIHLLEGMSAEQRALGNLTTLRLHNVYLQLESLEAPGVELQLQVLDLSGSVLEAKANPKDPPLEHVVLPRLEELDITRFGVTDKSPSGYEYFRSYYSSTAELFNFKHIVKAANVGMRLHKLTLVGFTSYDIRSFAPEDLTLYVPSPHLEELSLNFCPARMRVNFANLRSLRLEHRFSSDPAQRAAESHEVDMRAWTCGRLDSLTIVLGSYKKGDVFQVQCKPGMNATVSYPAEEWGKWVIGVRLREGKFRQSRQVTFVCAINHRVLAWAHCRLPRGIAGGMD
ncbi:hypothetical protein COCOBI_11-0240 [Coccomyxa sp. Obi]|nr:hypothetical protein COCOBI_11-0240 [Coccomyxa sp. Obi]